MTTGQVAINSLLRCLNYTEDKRDSNSSFYSSGIETLVEIRELASQLMLAANDALAKVNLNDNRFILANPSLDIEEIKEEIQQDTLEYVVNQLNVIQQQTIHIEKIETVNQCNQINEQPIVQELNSNEIEVTVEDIIEDKKENKALRKNFISEFKNILNYVATLPDSKFSNQEIQKCAKICSRYFQARFDKKGDKYNIHKFSSKEFRNYLASIILKFSEAASLGDIDTFIEEFDLWIENLFKYPQKYTLPKSIAEIYFSISGQNVFNNQIVFCEDTIDYANKLWDELWILGYHKFSYLGEYSPTKSFTWVKINSAKTNLQNHQYDEIINLWYELSQHDTFKLFRAIAIANDENLQKLQYQNDVDLPKEVLQKSLSIYMKTSKDSNLEEIKMKLISISQLIEYIDTNYHDSQSAYEYLKSYPYSDLELVDVLSHYAKYCSAGCYE